MTEQPVRDKVAVVTGGSSGIGLAAARLLSERGAHVVLVGRDADKLDVARRSLARAGDVVSADVSTVDGVDAMAWFVRERHGRADILFINAGISDCPPILETGEADFDRIVDINLKGAFFTFTRMLPLLSTGASVVFTSSVAEDKGRPGDPLYAATKAAVRSLVRTLALDEAVLAKEVRVNAVTPGTIATPLTAQDTPELTKAIDAYVAEAVPAGRWGRPEEVAQAVLFLAGPYSSYTTGSEIHVDGGLAQS